MTIITPDTPDFLRTTSAVSGANVVANVVNQASNAANLLTLQPTTRYLFVVPNIGTSPSLTSCIGATSGVDWSVFASSNPGAGINDFVVIPVVAAVDTQVTLKLGNALGLNIFVVVESPSGDLFGLPAFPQTVALVTQATEGQSSTVVNGGGGGWMPPPGANTINRIRSLGFAGGPTTVAATIRFVGALSGAVYLGQSGAAGSFLNVHMEPAQLDLTEGLNVTNASGVSVIAWVSYTPLPSFV